MCVCGVVRVFLQQQKQCVRSETNWNEYEIRKRKRKTVFIKSEKKKIK